jgi:hypothetical protein
MLGGDDTPSDSVLGLLAFGSVMWVGICSEVSRSCELVFLSSAQKPRRFRSGPECCQGFALSAVWMTYQVDSGVTCRIDTPWISGQDSQLSSARVIYKTILVEERACLLG